MRFYTMTHTNYCGIDPQAQALYLCSGSPRRRRPRRLSRPSPRSWSASLAGTSRTAPSSSGAKCTPRAGSLQIGRPPCPSCTAHEPRRIPSPPAPLQAPACNAGALMRPERRYPQIDPSKRHPPRLSMARGSPAAPLRAADSPDRSEPPSASAPTECPIRASCWRFSSTDLIRDDAAPCPARTPRSRTRSYSLDGVLWQGARHRNKAFESRFGSDSTLSESMTGESQALVEPYRSRVGFEHLQFKPKYSSPKRPILRRREHLRSDTPTTKRLNDSHSEARDVARLRVEATRQLEMADDCGPVVREQKDPIFPLCEGTQEGRFFGDGIDPVVPQESGKRFSA